MTESPGSQVVRINPGGASPPNAYENIIGHGLLDGLRARVDKVLGPGRRAIVLADRSLSSPHISACAAVADVILRWTPDESAKNLGSASTFLKQMAVEGLDRSSFVITLGGGITGDVGGFVASVYQRGIPWINCPTTLLAMVDASIGGKTGVNLDLPNSPSMKNYVGTIHHPVLVVSDVATLKSLPDRAFRAGLAECVKHIMIAADWGMPDLGQWTRSHLARILSREPADLIELIARNTTLKSRVVAADERESGVGKGGGRMALNLGHTFAHAIETLPEVSCPGLSHPLQHGEAVGLGLIAAAKSAEALGLCTSALTEEIRANLEACGLPVVAQGLPPDDEIVARMARDKKTRAGSIRLILPQGRGSVRVVDNPPAEAIHAGLGAIRA